VHAHGEDLRLASGDATLAEQVKHDYRTAALDERSRRMLDYAVLVTERVHAVNGASVSGLREVGFSDADILDITEIAGFFNMYNRLADALDVDLEAGMPNRPSPAAIPRPS
jgi:uncharacterized peroxidase-related enzyme